MDVSEAMKVTDPVNLQRHPWEVARRSIIKFLISKQRGFPFSHIADIGAGDGFILQYLLEMNAATRFSAIDPSFNDDILSRLKKLPGAKRIQFHTRIDEISSDGTRVDCVLLLDVLEHVPNDEGLISEIRQFAGIGTGATWIITVPAFQRLFSHHDKLLHHHRRYSLRQLVTLCNRSGLKVEKKGYFFFSLIPLRFIQKLISRENGSTIQNWKGGKALGAVLRTALWIDFRVCLGLSNLRINIPGLSCYCICH